MASAFLLLPSCYGEVVADQCVWVALSGKEGQKLVPLLDEFATEQALQPNKTHPINPRYEWLDAKGELKAELSYLIGIGEFGAQLAYFTFEEAGEKSRGMEFRSLVSKISHQYSVKECTADQFPRIVE